MAKSVVIKIRISQLRVEALVEICKEMLAEFKPKNDHHALLLEYMRDLVHRLNGLLARPKDAYSIGFSTTEAMAFYQLWQMLDVRHDKYATVVVEGILKKINEATP